jgi:ABC-type branched-subunit amino acid transport system ATPase component
MLALKQLSFSFPSWTILDGVSLQLRSHAVTRLLGGNGSGKTTLFNLITGFLRPDAGSIRLGETDLAHRAPFRISRAGVARTFQELRLIGKLTVRENLLLALTRPADERLGTALLPSHRRASSLSSSTEERAGVRSRNELPASSADSLLADYFLAGVADQLASEISYGHQQLLTLACCAALVASLLLLDAPVGRHQPRIPRAHRQPQGDREDHPAHLASAGLSGAHRRCFPLPASRPAPPLRHPRRSPRCARRARGPQLK